jgi:copper chaperone CopZ
MSRRNFISGLVAALALTFAIPGFLARAGDKPSFTFVANIAGIVCEGCKTHISESLAKLEGVTNVEFAVGSTPGTHTVTVTSSNAALTKEQAVASLGPEAETYKVQSWDKK